MKKFITTLVVFASLSLSLAAVADVQTNAAQNPAKNPTKVGAPSNETDDASFNSQAFGWHGPFTVTGYYSSKLGSYLDLKYVNYLNNYNSFAFELGFGSAQFRIAGTWAHELTKNQRFKITAEHLAQDIDFDYVTGSAGQWIGQNAIGAGYQYLLHKRWLSSLDATAYYADADSANLGDKKFIAANGTPMIDQRHMAGARSVGFSAGFHMQPWASGLIGVALNYDSVKYDTEYVPGDNTSGIGGTISFDQIVTPRLKFGLMASDRKPWSQYAANVMWLAPSWAGTRLQVGLVASHITGDLPESGDNRIGLQLLYTWGGDKMAPPLLYTVPTLNGPTSLLAYVNTPAVHMPQVLVMKDERVIRDPSAQQPIAQLQTDAAANANKPIVLVPNKPVTISASQYFSAAPSSNVSYSASQLPAGLQLDSKTGTISGELPKSAAGNQYNVTVQAEPMLNLHKPGAFIDLQPVSQELTLSVEQAPVCNLPSKITRNADEALTGDNSINIAQYCTGSSLKYAVSNTGSANISINNTSGVITGPAQAPNSSTVTLTVSNEAGTIHPGFILAIIINPNVTSKPIPAEWAAIGEGFNLDVSDKFHTNFGSLQYSLENAPAWMSINTTSGVISGTPPTGAGTVDATAIKVVAKQYQSGKATGRSGEQTLKVFIKPTYTAVSLPQVATTGKPFAIQTQFDARGSVALTYQVSSSPEISGLSVASNGVISGTGPAAGASYQITVDATKAPGDGLAPVKVQETFPLTVLTAPVGSNFGPIWVNFNNQGEIADASQHFTNGGGTLQYSLANNPSWLSVNQNSGAISMADDQASDTGSITVTATQYANGKATGNLASADFSVKVNPSVSQTVIPITLQASQSSQVKLSDYFAAHGGQLTYSLKADGNAVTWVSLSGSDVNIAPPLNTAPGQYKFTVTGVKEAGHEVSATIDVTVKPFVYFYAMQCPTAPNTSQSAKALNGGPALQIQFAGQAPSNNLWQLKKADVVNGQFNCTYGTQFSVPESWRTISAGPAQKVMNAQAQGTCPGTGCEVKFQR